jgi:hypothetical protein
MTTTAPFTESPWRLGFTSIEAETPQEIDLAIEGSLPSEVKGTLYRIGPARFEVGGERYQHWFDGDGMVHAIHSARGAPRTAAVSSPHLPSRSRTRPGAGCWLVVSPARRPEVHFTGSVTPDPRTWPTST